MGTTTYMAMNSMDQSWADKVELAIFLAPVAYVAHMRSSYPSDFLLNAIFIFSSWLPSLTKSSLWWTTWG